MFCIIQERAAEEGPVMNPLDDLPGVAMQQLLGKQQTLAFLLPLSVEEAVQQVCPLPLEASKVAWTCPELVCQIPQQSLHPDFLTHH